MSANGQFQLSIDNGRLYRQLLLPRQGQFSRAADIYNVERHSYLGDINPTEFETLWTSTYSIPQLA